MTRDQIDLIAKREIKKWKEQYPWMDLRNNIKVHGDADEMFESWIAANIEYQAKQQIKMVQEQWNKFVGSYTVKTPLKLYNPQISGKIK